MAGFEYYDHTTYPVTGAPGSSAAQRAELDRIEAGFDKCVPLAGNGGKIVAVNAAATAQEAVDTVGTGNVVRAAGITGTGNAVLSNDPTLVLTDITTNNASTSQHGWMQKYPGNAALFLNGAGNFVLPPSQSLIPSVRTSNTILGLSDNGALIQVTTGGFTQTVTSAATLGTGWYVLYWNNTAASNVTIDPAGAETINGAASLTILPGHAYYVVANGANLVAIRVAEPVGTHEVVVHTGAGFGSTNTAIRRFSTALVNTGTAITYADSATLGASFTINESGTYSITSTGQGGGGLATEVTVGISLNSAQLTLPIDDAGLTVSARLGAAGGTYLPSVTRVVTLAAGDIVRAHYGQMANAVNGFSTTAFSIKKISV